MNACPRCHKENRPGVLLCEFCGMVISVDLSTHRLDKAAEGLLALPTTGETRLLDKMKLLLDINDGQIQLTVEVKPEADAQLTLGRTVPGTEGKVDIDLTPYCGADNLLGVSRFHAVIRRVGINLTLMDTGSTNGTYVNGTLLKSGEPIFLHDPTEIFLGWLKMVIYYIR